MMFNKSQANRFFSFRGILFLIVIGGLIAAATEIRSQTTYTNTTPITINDNSPATPYPSTITIPGPNCSITDLNVGINNFSHTFADDVGVLLVGPQGQKVRLFTDVGGTRVVNPFIVNLVFDDAALAGIPDEGPIVSGSFKPAAGIIFGLSAQHPANFPAPAPASPYSLLLSSFNNTNQAGTWSLYVNDDTGADVGSIASWSLTTTCMTSAAAVTVAGRVTNASGRGIRSALVSLTDQNGETRLARTGAFGYFKFEEVASGAAYVIDVRAKGYQFVPQVITVNDDLTDLSLVLQ